MASVIHKTLAKRTSLRFAEARQFTDALRKTGRNEPIQIFDSSLAQSRIERAIEAFGRNNIQLSAEILEDLEADGHINDEMVQVRLRIREGLRVQLLVHARQALEIGEFSLALRKIDEALTVAPDSEDALNLRREVETARTAREVNEWLLLARSHLDEYRFVEAHRAVQQGPGLDPDSADAIKVLTEVREKEANCLKIKEKARTRYESAKADLERGGILLAQEKLLTLIDLDHRHPYLAGHAEAGVRDMHTECFLMHVVESNPEITKVHLGACFVYNPLDPCGT